jgi:hypothetical protein
MAGMACAFFLYAASGLVAPWWNVILMLAVWLVLFGFACRWWTPHPLRVLVLPVVALGVWVLVISAGSR